MDCVWFLGESREKRIFHKFDGMHKPSQENVNTGIHGSTELNPMTSYVIYKAYVLPRLLYGLETLTLTKGQVEQLSKYHIQDS